MNRRSFMALLGLAPVVAPMAAQAENVARGTIGQWYSGWDALTLPDDPYVSIEDISEAFRAINPYVTYRHADPFNVEGKMHLWAIGGRWQHGDKGVAHYAIVDGMEFPRRSALPAIVAEGKQRYTSSVAARG